MVEHLLGAAPFALRLGQVRPADLVADNLRRLQLTGVGLRRDAPVDLERGHRVVVNRVQEHPDGVGGQPGAVQHLRPRPLAGADRVGLGLVPGRLGLARRRAVLRAAPAPARPRRRHRLPAPPPQARLPGHHVEQHAGRVSSSTGIADRSDIHARIVALAITQTPAHYGPVRNSGSVIRLRAQRSFGPIRNSRPPPAPARGHRRGRPRAVPPYGTGGPRVRKRPGSGLTPTQSRDRPAYAKDPRCACAYGSAGGMRMRNGARTPPCAPHTGRTGTSNNAPGASDHPPRTAAPATAMPIAPRPPAASQSPRGARPTSAQPMRNRLRRASQGRSRAEHCAVPDCAADRSRSATTARAVAVAAPACSKGRLAARKCSAPGCSKGGLAARECSNDRSFGSGAAPVAPPGVQHPAARTLARNPDGRTAVHRA